MKYLRRAAVFLAKRAIIILVVVSLLIYGFYLAFNLSNAYIIVSEGLEKRVSVTLTRTDSAALYNYFTSSFIASDPVLSASKQGTDTYRYFDINSFEYEAEVSSLFWRPLKSVKIGSSEYKGIITCTVTERVSNITGSLKSEYASSDVAEISQWESLRYKVTLVKVDGRWVIGAIEQDNTYQDPNSK